MPGTSEPIGYGGTLTGSNFSSCAPSSPTARTESVWVPSGSGGRLARTVIGSTAR